MSVVGFDIGNDNCVIAAVKQRGIDVLLNDESSRQTPAVVSFSDKQRFLGSAGAASASMNPRSTVSQIKRLLSRADDCFPFPTSRSPDDSVLVHINNRAYTPIQLLAMLLSHLKQTAEKDLNAPVSDCVIAVPSYFTDAHRRAYLDAAAIAGLRPLRLLHDSTATALGYGIYKHDSETVVFVDIGHSDTQVSVVSFKPGRMHVLSHSYDADLGGRDFDELLFNHFSDKFNKEYNIDVRGNVRASVRLRLACEKLKKVLSANAEAPLSIECLMDEKDVKGFIRREEFESLSAGLLERVLVPCKKALADARVGEDRIGSVELIGSGSRIPAIARILGNFFRKEPSRTVNASECVARGCALQCAMLSPTFKVREYEVQDSFPFSVGFSSDEGPISKRSSDILFQKGQSVPSVKLLTFLRSSTFHLEAFYADPSELPPRTARTICSFKILSFRTCVRGVKLFLHKCAFLLRELEEFKRASTLEKDTKGLFGSALFLVSQGEKSKVKVKLRLNLHGIVSVESAWLVEDVMNDPLSRDTSQYNMDKMDMEEWNFRTF